MTLNISDKSNYLKGILVLIGKDRNIENSDEKMIRFIAEELGFNHYFVDKSIDEIKEHKYILEEPPEFSNHEIAKAFIKDAIRFAFSDHSLHLYEFQWLSTIAFKNKLSGQWLLFEIKYFLSDNHSAQDSSFEIQKYVEPVFQ